MTRSVDISTATPGDAPALNAYIRATYASARHLITRPEEFIMGPWRQRFWIAKRGQDPFALCLLAKENDKIIGMLDCWTDRRKAVQHVTTFAMSVAPAYHRCGVGRMLLSDFITWVQRHKTLEKIELHVHADNIAARSLYKNLGFTEEGMRKGAVMGQDGSYIDDILMGLWPDKKDM